MAVEDSLYSSFSFGRVRLRNTIVISLTMAILGAIGVFLSVDLEPSALVEPVTAADSEAFFHPQRVAKPHFSMEHLRAVYLPLVAPVILPRAFAVGSVLRR